MFPKEFVIDTIFKILDAEQEDLEQIYRLNKEIFGADCIKRDWLQDFYSEALRFLKIVLIPKKEIIGAISIVPDLRGRKDRVYVSMLFVHPSYQRKGLGSYLFEHIVYPYFSQQDYKIIELNTKESTPATTQFYKKVGFEIIGEIRRYYRSGDNCFIMQKHLD